MFFEDDRESESDRNKHQNILKYRDQHGMVVLNNDPSIAAEQFEIIDHFICFVGASAQNRKQKDDRSPDEKNDTGYSLNSVKYALFIQSDRKKHTESHD